MKKLLTIFMFVVMFTTFSHATMSLSPRILFLTGEINQEAVVAVENFILSNQNLNPDTDRLLLMLSGPGGGVLEMREIIGLMDLSKIPVDTMLVGIGASADAEIFLNGKQRFFETGVLLFHKAHSNSPITDPIEQDGLDVINRAEENQIKVKHHFSDAMMQFLFQENGFLRSISPKMALKYNISTTIQNPDLIKYGFIGVNNK